MPLTMTTLFPVIKLQIIMSMLDSSHNSLITISVTLAEFQNASKSISEILVFSTRLMEPANKKQIYSLWRKQSKGRLGYTDYNNLFNELLLRLHTVEDWNFGISIERSRNGGSVPIAGF